MIYLYMLPGLLLFVFNVVLFTHTEEVENHTNLNLSDVHDMKQLVWNLPHETHFMLATLMTVIVAVVFVACVGFWPLLLIIALIERNSN